MRQQTSEDAVRCTAWTDPATLRVNVTFVLDTGDGIVSVATDYDCTTRGLRFDHELNEDLPEPSPVTASLTRNEAIALLDALDRLELVERGPRLSQHVPGTVPGRMPRAGGAPWTG